MKNARLLVCIVLLACGPAAVAGTNTFTSTGPSGGSTYDVRFVGGGALVAVASRGTYRSTDNGANWARVASIDSNTFARLAVNPANRNQVLLGSFSLQRSTDGGVTWTLVPGLPRLSSNYVTSVAFAANGSVAYMSTANDSNLFRSIDGGVSWNEIPSNLTSGINAIEVDAVDPQRLYVLTGAGGYRSIDGGVTFSKFGFDPYLSSVIAASRSTSGWLLARSGVAGSLPWESTDGGTTWNELTAGDSRNWVDFGMLPSGGFGRPAFDPSQVNHMALATYGGLLISNDGGATWLERFSGFQEANARQVVVSRAGAGAIYLVVADSAAVYRRDGGSGAWNAAAAVVNPAVALDSGYDQATALAPAPQDANLLYLARNGRIEVSLDGGLHWAARGALFAETLAVAPDNSQVVYAGTHAHEPMRSLDGGASWTSLAAAGLPVGAMHFAFDPTNPSVIYAGVSNYFAPAPHPVYKSVNGGASFTATGWNPASDPGTFGWLVHHPTRTSVLYFGTFRGVYKTTDGGATWTRSPSFDTLALNYGMSNVLIDPQSPEIVYASGYYHSLIARSVNGGATWDAIGSTAANDPFSHIALVPGTRTKIIGSRANGSGEMDLVGDLRLTSADTTEVQGSLASTTFVVANRSAFALSDVRLTATLPSSSTAYVATAAGGACAVTGQELMCTLGALAAQATANVTVTLTPSSAGSWSATASAYEPEATSGDNGVGITVSGPPAGGAGRGGGGGGGALDYLLLAALAACAAAALRGRPRTPANPVPVPPS